MNASISKKLKFLHLLIILCININSFGQANPKELQISYNFHLDIADFTLKSTLVNHKQLDSLIFFENSLPNFNIKKNMVVLKLFKSFSEHMMIQEVELMKGKRTLVKEELNLFDWQLIAGTEQILGYSCQKAEAHFRGRDYTAFFTTEIPFKAAPWKFHGVPGTMLKVTSQDKVIAIEATAIKIKQKSKELSNPFKDKKYYSWERYVKKFTDQFEQYRAQFKKSSSYKLSGGSNIEKFEFFIH